MRRSVATFPNRREAEVAQGLLASAGIDAWIAADDAGGAFPSEIGNQKPGSRAGAGLIELQQSPQSPFY